MDRDEIIEAVVDYLDENTELRNYVVETLDDELNFLGEDRWYPMEDIDDRLAGLSHTEVMTMAFYGGDDDSETENGHRGEFCPNRDYYRVDGNTLISSDFKGYGEYVNEALVEDIRAYRNSLDLPTEVEELLEQLDELEG